MLIPIPMFIASKRGSREKDSASVMPNQENRCTAKPSAANMRKYRRQRRQS
jgi:hypothetical protein